MIEGRATPFIRIVAFLARVLSSSLARVRIAGALDALPREGPLILAANHASNADGIILGGWLTPALGRRIHWLGKREMLEWPILGPIARHGGVHPVDRGAADVEAFRTAERILEEGHVLMVFPEGTRSPDGKLQRPRDGLAMLALRTGAPIVPIGIGGAHRAWPKGGRPRFGQLVTVRVGQPFVVGDDGSGPGGRRAAKSAATDRIMREIAALLPPDQRGAYA